MRIVATFPHENRARKLAKHLFAAGIESKIEPLYGPGDALSYEIWVADEEHLARAEALAAEFLASPDHPKFEEPLIDQEGIAPSVRLKVVIAPLTAFFLFLCSAIYFYNAFFEGVVPGIPLTPLQGDLLFDSSLQFRGFYTYIVLLLTGEAPSLALGPLFTSIREGEVWRLFTPSLLHGGFFHILFNMLWLWALGRPIEDRIGSLRYLLLTLFAGIVSNTAQYLMSGALFLGYSGIITALAAFIWIREKKAPWEGYPIIRRGLIFLALFVLALFLLQIFSFFLQVIWGLSVIPPIANTGHIVGALVGFAFAHVEYLARKQR